METLDRTEAYEEDGINETALRILNLLFILNSSATPLTTEQIISDVDLGYGSSNRTSDLKKFRRDREKLAERGIMVSEIKPAGAQSNEESLWAIDRESTYAAQGVITPDDAETLERAIDECLSRDEIPFRSALIDIRMRLRALTGTDTEERPDDRSAQDRNGSGHASDALWSAFMLRRKIRFAYVDARGNESTRVLAVWGVFMQGGHTYYVGLDEQTGGVRTFRADRIARAWRPTGNYTVPSWFDVREYLFLPFDMAGGMATKVSFTCDARASEAELRQLTRERGTLTRDDTGTWTWTIRVCDIEAAARFALAHAHTGLRPAAPRSLVDAWNALISKAVEAHA